MTVYINGVAEVGISLQDVKDNVKLNELQNPDGAVALATQILDNIGAPADAGDALRKGTRIGKDNLQWTSNKLLKGAGSSSDPTEIDVPASGGQSIFGDGSDGDVTLGSNTTLTRDMFYNTLDTAGYNLNADGYRIFVKGTLTNTGTIHNNGNNGTVGASPGSSVPGGVNTNPGSLGLGRWGGNGNRDTTGQDGNSVAPQLGGDGGNGGNGATTNGGNGGTVTAPVADRGGFRSLPFAIILKDISTTVTKIGGGAGGAGGGGDGTNTGGGGGGGAGVLVIAAKAIVNTSGTISCNGGSGGDGAVGDNCGGGGGGGGGVLVLIYGTLTANSEVASGGAGGTLSGTGTNGAAGSAGIVIKIVSG